MQISARYIIILVLILTRSAVYSQNQAPAITHQHSYGGTHDESASCVCKTSDGGYIVTGLSYSNDFDVRGHHGSTDSGDGWVLKFDSKGMLQWQHSYGGSGDDVLTRVQQTFDGGFIFVGTSSSIDGDATRHHGAQTTPDLWVVKTNSLGDTMWTRSLGGTSGDAGSDIRQTADSGYIISGATASSDGDLTTHHGNNTQTDAWFIKLDKFGKMEWQHSYGGSHDDEGSSILQTISGDYIAIGSSASNDGDATGHHGSTDSSDFWLLHLDSQGKLLFQKQLGGSGNDGGFQIEKTNDGNFLAVGLSLSDNGDVTTYKQTDSTHYNIWIVKIDESGNIIWQNSILGMAENTSTFAITSDGGAIISGVSSPTDNAVNQSNPPALSAIITKLDLNGKIEWEGMYPGGKNTGAISIAERAPGNYVFAGAEDSVGQNVTNNNGGIDFWIAEFNQPENGVAAPIQNSDISLFPNPTNGILTIEDAQKFMNVTVTNILGETVIVLKNPNSPNLSLDLSKLVPGTYYIRFFSANSVLMKMVVRE